MRLHAANLLMLTTALSAASASAQVPEDCRTPTFSDVGWTDISATTATADLILSSIGYEPEVLILSVPVTFDSLKRGEVDVFLGNWMPLHEPMQVPLVEAGEVDLIATNLEGAVVGLATTAAGAELGIRTYADIAAFQDELDGKIYGIEAGSSANETLLEAINTDTFDLGEFELVESSEQAMLSQVRRAANAGEPIVFFGWRPHPMNVTLDMVYLTDSQNLFGPNDGAATVHTLTRPGLADECPNLARFLENLVFEVSAEDLMMKTILDDGMSPPEAADAWLKENPEAVDRWLEGVTTVEGEPAAPAVKEALGL
jgi:glycine betaine/proline transport system substrate-binding protein